MGQERIEFQTVPQALAGVFLTQKAVFHPTVLLAAPDDGARLMALPSSAAWATVLHVMNGAQAAGQTFGSFSSRLFLTISCSVLVPVALPLRELGRRGLQCIFCQSV